MKAYELLSDETKWCQHAEAITVNSIYVFPYDPRAVRWCLVGAVKRCYIGYDNCLERITEAIPADERRENVAEWNDAPERTYADVVGMLRRLEI